ncbi:MAG: hypothetical protein ABIM99_01765 [Candidatus Dojkabacteria bacterium]
MQNPLDILKAEFDYEKTILPTLQGIKLIQTVQIPLADDDASKRIRHANINKVLSIFKANQFAFEQVQGVVITFIPPTDDINVDGKAKHDISRAVTINFREAFVFTAHLTDFGLSALVIFSKSGERLMTFNDQIRDFSTAIEF